MAITSPLAIDGSEAEADRVGAAQPLPVGKLAVALAILAVVFALGAITALGVSWNLSAADRAELEALEKLDCVVIQTGVKTTFLPTPAAVGVPPAALPRGVSAGDWECEPQILVRYVSEGEAVEQWLSIAEPFESNDQWRAQQMLQHYGVGDELTVWHAAGDPSELFLKPGHGGRQTLITGRIIAGFLTLPALGFVLAAILLWQAARRQAAGQQGAAAASATNRPATAARESAGS